VLSINHVNVEALAPGGAVAPRGGGGNVALDQGKNGDSNNQLDEYAWMSCTVSLISP
jgi:hypothetical protein